MWALNLGISAQSFYFSYSSRYYYHAVYRIKITYRNLCRYQKYKSSQLWHWECHLCIYSYSPLNSELGFIIDFETETLCLLCLTYFSQTIEIELELYSAVWTIEIELEMYSAVWKTSRFHVCRIHNYSF